MKKILRSFLHEQLPLDLRVEIELLSRRRDIFNAEKQEELIKLLRKFNIPGIVPLGSGTNRYAFKLNGFVVKVATDNDGKIDNFKEYKMAKRLYPYVAKTYEVSENGTLLVAEYIEPFQSYGEMLAYADQIRDILKKLSSVYLIGDVGITKKNYANWGKRIGSDDPVCLDFAYVYDVKSELFLCKACKNNSMLIPNNDFTKLICPAVGCGKEYEFEEIRARLGNDIHAHEIGDLTKEGYLMYDSNQETELDCERSNYLAKPIEEVKEEKKQEEETIPDNFIFNNKEEQEMMGTKVFGKHMVTLEASSVEVVNDNLDENVTVVEAVAVDDVFGGSMNDASNDDLESMIAGIAADVEEESNEANNEASDDVNEQAALDTLMGSSGVAFSGSIDEESNEDASDTTENDDESTETEEANEVEAEPVVVEATPVQEEQAVAGELTDMDTASEVKEYENEDYSHTFSKYFIDNMYQAPLEFGRKVADGYLYKKVQIFDSVRSSIVNKKGETLYPEKFYNTMAYIINHTILDFCEFQVVEGVNKRGKACKNYIAPEFITGMPYEDTIVFLSRFYCDKSLRYINDGENLMEAYKAKYDDCIGLQNEIIDILSTKIHESFNISNIGVNVIIDALVEGGFIADAVVVNNSTEEAPVEEVAEEESNDVNNEASDDANEQAALDTLLGSGDIDAPEESAEDYSDDEEYEDEPEYEVTGVYVYPEDDLSVINIVSPGAFGTLQIPIYVNLNNVDGNKLSPSMTYDGNKEWDWLVHLNADNVFRTDDPEKYLALNDIMNYEDSIIRFAVLDETEQGDFIVGMWVVGVIAEVDEEFEQHLIWDDKEKMNKLNNIIVDNIGISCVSHLKMTLSNPDLILSEDEFNERYAHIFEEYFDMQQNEVVEEETNETNDEAAEDANEQAALDTLLGSGEMATFKPIHRMKD